MRGVGGIAGLCGALLSRLDSEAPEGGGGGVAVYSVRGEWEMVPGGEWSLTKEGCVLP